MSKNKNHKLYGTPEQIKIWKEEIDFIGRDSMIKDGVLIVFAIDRRHGKKHKEKESRDKRKEKFSRRTEKSSSDS